MSIHHQEDDDRDQDPEKSSSSHWAEMRIDHFHTCQQRNRQTPHREPEKGRNTKEAEQNVALVTHWTKTTQ